jgi:transcriptional regulator with XRE-family HTH domain
MKHVPTVVEGPCERGTDRPPLCGRNRRTLGPVDGTSDVAEFLTSRRARVTPEEAGLPSHGKRRVPGLRREEVASLAGVSVEYYKRLERGNLSGVSDMVLDALARALRLDDAERTHLFDLARAAGPAAPQRRRPVQTRVRPAVQRILDQLRTPAIVRNARGDYVAANQLGRALYAPLFESREQPANSARFTFLDPAAVDYFADWERVANDIVAHLRSEAGRNRYDRDLSDLVGELSTRSNEFRTRWAAHNVRFHRTGSKRIHHPVVGELELSYESMELSADSGLTLNVHTAEADSTSQHALDLLASWTATLADEQSQAADAARPSS